MGFVGGAESGRMPVMVCGMRSRGTLDKRPLIARDEDEQSIAIVVKEPWMSRGGWRDVTTH